MTLAGFVIPKDHVANTAA